MTADLPWTLEVVTIPVTDLVTPVRSFGRDPGETPHPLDNVGFMFFQDPDGNEWAVQQISSRARDDDERPLPT